MQNANDRTAATPPFEDAMPTIPDEAWKQPPLADAVTGVVRLRNEEKVPVRRQGDEVREVAETRSRSWPTTGEWLYNGRHPNDIVAQVSVGPTGPGVYALDGDGRAHLTGKDERGWRVHAKDPWYRDDFGRCFDNYGTRYVTGDLRRRIGDLPVPEAVPEPKPTVVFQPAGENRWKFDPANDYTTIVLSCETGCWELSYLTPVGTETTEVLTIAGLYEQLRRWGMLPPEARSEREIGFGGATGEPLVVRRWNETIPFPDPAHSPPSYPASEGRAAMDALWGDGVPTVDLRTREWLREMVREVVAADVVANRQGVVITASPESFAISEADILPVSRDDLRVLFYGLRDAAEMCGHGCEPDFRVLSRAAAALGDVELPEWMREHAKREGWTT